MPTTYKILGQSSATANTETVLYQVPAATETVVSSLVICNRDPANRTFRVAVKPANVTTADQHYIAYNTTVLSSDTVILTMGMTLGNTDSVVVYTPNSSNVSYSIFGSEIS